MADAQAAGADAFFDEKYGEQGPHDPRRGLQPRAVRRHPLPRAGEVGNFIITGERSIGSGVRRIEAVTGAAADRLMEHRFDLLERAATAVGARSEDAVEERIAALQDELRETKRRLKAGAAAGGRPEAGRPGRAAPRPSATGWRSSAAALDLDSMDALKGFAKDLRGLAAGGVIALGLDADEPQLFVTVSDDLVARGIAAGPLVSGAVSSIDGRGGGRPGDGPGQGHAAGGARGRDRGRARRGGRPRRLRVTTGRARGRAA